MMKAVFLSAFLLAASVSGAGAGQIDDYMKSATEILLLGQACAAIGHAPKHDGMVVETVADLVSMGYGDGDAAVAVDSLLREKGPGVTSILTDEAASNPAATTYFCETAYPERLALHERVRASLGLR